MPDTVNKACKDCKALVTVKTYSSNIEEQQKEVKHCPGCGGELEVLEGNYRVKAK